MAKQGLTVAVTGPTGDLGQAMVAALERSRAVKRVKGMARRPFDPAERGWKKTEYVQGDVQDERSVRDLVADADVVVHLAFAILDAGEDTRELNIEGSRRVFELSARAVASAFLAGVQGKGPPGPYNLAGRGTLTMSDLADALGWYSVPVPELAVNTTAEVVSRLPLPAATSWIHSVRKPVLMKTGRAERELGWKPEYTGKATLKALVAARNASGPAAR